jgi:hypothetical protein
MNEAVVIRFLNSGGDAVAVKALSQDGLLLEADGDCWPRPASIEFYPEAEATRVRLDWLRQRYGWDTVRWNVTARDGELVIAGIVEDGLPPGIYRLRVSVADLLLLKPLCLVEVKDGQPTHIDVRVQDDDRRVVLTRPPARFDAEIRRVVQNAASSLEGRPAADWIADPTVNAHRKACVLNLLAKLRSVPRDLPLIGSVNSLFFASFDRMYVSVAPEFHARLFALAGDNKRSFYYEGHPVASVHQRLIDEAIDAKLEPRGAQLILESFREQGTHCMQAVMAVPGETLAPGQTGGRYADLDIDLGNPLQDVEGLLIHCGELANVFGITDHLALRKPLGKQPAGEYLYYDVAAS